MTAASGTRRLDVRRTLSDGRTVPAGSLAQGEAGVFFQYDTECLARHPSLSPFNPPEDTALHSAERDPHEGLYGVFADSLPDGWGRLLMDRAFRGRDDLPDLPAPLDRLAYVGDRGTGALSYEPATAQPSQERERMLRVGELGHAAQALHEGRVNEVLEALFATASAAGARPKAHLYLAEDDRYCSTTPAPGTLPCLVKFTSARLPLGHEEGACEAAYLTLAARAGIDTPDWRLVTTDTPSGTRRWLAQTRFDRCRTGPADDLHSGRLHFVSACGLLDADFRAPTLDYEDLIKAAGILCRSPAAGQETFRRAAFNLFARNQDDHSRNWGFLQDDDGRWRPAPFYDVTHSPHPRDEHATAYAGHGRRPPPDAMRTLAAHAGFAAWERAREVLEEVADAVAQWPEVARELEIRPEIRRPVAASLAQTRRDNRRLLAPGP